MREVRYGVAMSLDGYIAGPNGEADWIIMDPEIDFASAFQRFDTLLIGRKSFEAMQGMGGGGGGMGVEIRSVILSKTLRPEDHPDQEIINDGLQFVGDLKKEPGKDIWLWGGGELFRSLLNAGLVDGVDVAVMPVLLGDGKRLLPSPSASKSLTLKNHTVFASSGIVALEYDVTNRE